ncbi:hypothetical protein [Parasutterella secunda]|uniref:hypothetical protein n=1 Tax=Parasutterella secunda TaxID=626947 RepID=UPI00195F4595|nr:hypothetical protein [Parasutterella secunda]
MIYDENQKLYIAELLPRPAALALSRAAELAATLPVESVARKLAIQRTVDKVRAEYPEYFRHDAKCARVNRGLWETGR